MNLQDKLNAHMVAKAARLAAIKHADATRDEAALFAAAMAFEDERAAAFAIIVHTCSTIDEVTRKLAYLVASGLDDELAEGGRGRFLSEVAGREA
jgi:hypothetical protein